MKTLLQTKSRFLAGLICLCFAVFGDAVYGLPLENEPPSTCSAGEVVFENWNFASLNVCEGNTPETLTVLAQGQTYPDVLENTDLGYLYVSTTQENIILSIQENNGFTGLADNSGITRFYGFLYAGSLTGNIIGGNVNDLSASVCFSLSDFISLNVEDCPDPDCPELNDNFFHFCDDGDPNTVFDRINLNCECEGESICDAVANAIIFSTGETSHDYCAFTSGSQLPAIIFNGVSDTAEENSTWIVTDFFGHIYLVESILAELQNIDFENFGPPNLRVYYVNYDASSSNIDQIQENVSNLDDLMSCYDLSNFLTINIIDCGSEFDCPPLSGNFGDPCTNEDDIEGIITAGETGCFCDVPAEACVTVDLDEYCVDVGSDAYNETIANDPFCCEVAWDGICQAGYEFNNNGQCPCDAYGGVLATESNTTVCADSDDVVTVYYAENPNLNFGSAILVTDDSEDPVILDVLEPFGPYSFNNYPETYNNFQLWIYNEEIPQVGLFSIVSAIQNGETPQLSLATEHCYALSNPIAITRQSCTDCEANAGSISFPGGQSSTSSCIEDGEWTSIEIIPSEIIVTPGYSSIYLVTSNAGKILYLNQFLENIEDLAFGVFGFNPVHIYRVVYNTSESNIGILIPEYLNEDIFIQDFEGCFDLSNFLNVNLGECGFDCPLLESNIGDPCDDGLEFTINDVVGPACECIGLPPDCTFLFLNIGDPCDDGNPLTTNDTVQENCVCLGTPVIADCPGQPFSFGDACDDGNPATQNDVINGDCECEGTPIIVVDCPSLEANIGDACDDGNAGTQNDMINAECECEGTPITIVDCPNLNGNLGDPCDDGNPNTENDIIIYECLCEGTPVIVVDCPQWQANIGDTCDDGNPATQNDVINAECECEGSPIIVIDCPDLSANIGDACDDGNPSTQNDLINAECECEGSPIIVIDCPNLEGNIGDACDDGNPGTQNDAINSDCECEGTPIIVVDCPQFNANIGDTCDDGNPITFNDVITAECECEGTPFVVVDCPEFVGNIGDPCVGEGFTGTLTEDCECLPNEVDPCENYVYYLADVLSDGTTDIYGVELDQISMEANLSLLKEVDYEAHIAYNNQDGLLYLIRSANGSFRSLDVSVVDGALGAEIALSAPLTKAIAAGINEDGKLIIGDQNSDELTCVDLTTGLRAPYATADISGGDFAFGSDGTPYLATRSGNILYEVVPGLMNQMLGNVPPAVTGLALTELGDLIISSKGSGSLALRTSAGADLGMAFDLRLNGEDFITSDGDLASGCGSTPDDETECPGFKFYYTATNSPGVPAGTVFEGSFVGGNAVFTPLFSTGFEVHMAVNGLNGDLYLINANGSALHTYDETGALLNTVALNLSQTVALAWNAADGLVYAGSQNQDRIFTIDPVTGSTALWADNINVRGGDLVFNAAGELFLVTRVNNAPSILSNISLGVELPVGPVAPSVNGMAISANGGFMFSEGFGSSNIHLYNEDGTLSSIVDAVDNGGLPLVLFDGDMASACFAPETDIPEVGECYPTTVLDFNQGLQTNGAPVAFNRSNPNEALGAPDQSNAAGGFVSLGVGGYIVLGFDGIVEDIPGADILIFETSFSGNNCGLGDDEHAIISVSQNGIDFVELGTICRDGEVDIADAGLEYVIAVKITNAAITGTLDGYDVDGVIALPNCQEESFQSKAGLKDGKSRLSVSPNPTRGETQAIFTVSSQGSTQVEIFDMQGRSVISLFNQEAIPGTEYRLEYNGGSLPNGIYVYKLTTGNESIIEKFIIAK